MDEWDLENADPSQQVGARHHTVPAFYLRPQTVQDIVDQAVARVLDLLDVPHALAPRWAGEGA